MTMARAITWVPDQALSPYCPPDYGDRLRRAVWAIEELNDDRVAWHQYADLTLDEIAVVWKLIRREKKRHRR